MAEIRLSEKSSGKEATIEIEDSGNFLVQGMRTELLKNSSVDFAGAKLEHPLKKTGVLSVKVSKGTAVSAVKDACESIDKSAKEFSKKFADAYK